MGVACLDNCLYAVGGHDGVQHLNTVECYDQKVRVYNIKIDNSNHSCNTDWEMGICSTNENSSKRDCCRCIRGPYVCSR